MELKDRVKELRLISKLTQQDLARELNQIKLTDHDPRIFAQTISYWENGRDPSINALTKLSKFFEVSVDYLLGLDKVENIYEKWYDEGLNNLSIDKLKNYLEPFNEDTKKSIIFLFDGFKQQFVDIEELMDRESQAFVSIDLIKMFYMYFIAAPYKQFLETAYKFRACDSKEEADIYMKEMIKLRDFIDGQINESLDKILYSDFEETLNELVKDETEIRAEFIESEAQEIDA